VVVTSRRGALAETTAGFGRLVPPDDDRPAYVDQFVQATVQALRDLTGPEAAAMEDKLAEQIVYVRQTHTWPVLAGQWVPWLACLRAGRG